MSNNRISFFEDKILKGMWWRPDQPEFPLYGEVIYDQRKGLTLDLHGLQFKPDNDDGYIGLLHGRLETGSAITLRGCVVGSFNYGSTYPRCKYKLDELFIGKHFSSVEELCFDEVILEPEHLVEWIGEQELKTEELVTKGRKSGLKISLNLMEPIEYVLAGQLSLSVSTGFDFNSDRSGGNTLRREACITLGLESNRKLDEVMDLALRLSWFLSLFLFAPVRYKTVKLIKDGIPIYWLNRQIRGGDSKFSHFYMIPFSSVKKDLGRFFDSWLSFYKSCSDPCNLFFANFYSESLFVENQFTNFSQCMEVYHRERIGGHVASPEEKKEIFAIVKTALNQALHNPLHKKILSMLGPCREPGYKDRIAVLIQMLPMELKDTYFDDPDLYARRIRDIRNHLTHYSSEDDVSPLDKTALVARMELALSYHFLKEVGLGDELLTDPCLTRYKWLKRYPLKERSSAILAPVSSS